MLVRQRIFGSLMGSLAISAALLFSACKKDDVTDPGDTPPQPETSITFIVVDDSVAIADVLIGITPSESDRDAGVFLRTGQTSSTGRYKFSPLTPNTYYYSASWAKTTGTVKRTGSVELAQDERKSVNVVF